MCRFKAVGTILAVVIAGMGFANTAFGQGACCHPDGTCTVEADQATCEGLGGTYQGDGSDCIPLGACCFADGTCINTTQACCDGAAGTYKGDGTGCKGDNNGNGWDDICEDKSGACCMGDGSCSDLTLAECQQAGGTWRGAGTGCAGDSDGDGVDDICPMPAPVPTLTSPGLVVLALLLVIGGVIAVRRWKAQSA